MVSFYTLYFYVEETLLDSLLFFSDQNLYGHVNLEMGLAIYIKKTYIFN